MAADARQFYESFFGPEHIEQYQKDIRNILRHREIESELVSCPPGTCILDVGCGVGHVLRNVSPGFRKIGMDYSIESCRLSRAGGVGGGIVINGSIYQIPVHDASIDLAICLEVLEHLEDDGKALCEIARVLKPGGKIILSLPGSYYFLEYRELIGHLRHYHREGAVRDLEKFEGITRRYFYIFVLLEAGNRFLNLFRRKRKSIYQLCIPGVTRPIYDAWVIPWAEKQASLVRASGLPASDGHGVFLVAMKAGNFSS
jgi:ubiquinone/menaquinone biosynthesis C-methylase UbiE